MKRIIFINDQGGASIIVPAPDAVAQYGIEAIAKKDVPAGRRYKIVDAADIPQDRTDRNRWIVDEADLTDGIGADGNTFEGIL